MAIGGDKEKGRSEPKLPPGAVIPKVALSYEEAAWSLGISRSKLYRLVGEGRLPCVKIDGNTLLRVQDLQALVDANLSLNGARGHQLDPDDPLGR